MFYAQLLLVENTYGNEYRNMRKHIKEVCNKLKTQGKPHLAATRWTQLRTYLVPTGDELRIISDMLSDSARDLVVNVCA